MSDDLPKSIASSELTICGVTLRCHVLDNGQRIFEAESVQALLEAWADGVPFGEGEAEELARFTRS